jgi:hypothetical protein
MRADEIVDEIRITRETPGATGHIHFKATEIMQNVDGLADRLRAAYAEPALVPAFPWLERIPPARPFVSVAPDTVSGSPALVIRFAPAGKQPVRWWALQSRIEGRWRTTILPGTDRRYILEADESYADVVSLVAVDRSGNASVPALIRPR